MKTKVIPLSGEEAKLNSAYECFERDFISTYDMGSSPFVFASTANEHKTLRAYGEMKEKYIRENPGMEIVFSNTGSDSDKMDALSEVTAGALQPAAYRFVSAVPSLAPIVPYVLPRGSIQEVHNRAHENPNDRNLAKLVLERVSLKRIGERIYLFNGKYYRLLSRNELETTVVGVLDDFSQKRGDQSMIGAVCKFLVADPTILVEKPEQYYNWICMENGVLDINSGRLLPHNPQYFLTWKLCASWSEDEDCPVFREFIHTICGGDCVLMQRFLEVIGYILCARDNAWKRFVVMQGPSNCGKSVLGNLLGAFFEEDAVSSVPLFQFGERFALSTLVNKKLNLAMDLSAGQLKQEAVGNLKQITGRDRISVEEKYKSPFTTRIDTMLIFGTNHKISLDSYDPAFWERMLLLPFNCQIPASRQDPHLGKKLMAEKAGIFRLALYAYRTYLANGRVFSGEEMCRGLVQTQSTLSATRMDLIADFVERYIEANPDIFTPSADIFDCYQGYQAEYGYGSFPSSSSFSKALNEELNKQKIPYKAEKRRLGGRTPHGYVGITLKR